MAVKFVIDASVALKWQFKDESETEASIQMLTDFIEGKIYIFSPTLFIYEVVSAIHIAVSRHRIIEDEGIEIIRDVLGIGLMLADFSGLEENTLHMAKTYKRSVYDCAYLALAQKEGCNFYTGDKRLFNSTKNKLPFVKWIGNYTTAG
jgi:predicted nucleic acid-binding protein